ncbi:YhdP family protein [Kangiella sp. TOML190]|uniref:YhdP family protein n=1 Tax=Kangiella sp. TOML190 TaxID=2931351 RepID=UPI00203AFC5D|nr:YhdP family protein [Kangiella sp. TOML190]
MPSSASKFLSKLITKTIWLLSLVIIILVLLLSLLKFSLPYFLGKKEQVISFVESYIGGELNYQSLKVDWSGFHPQVLVEQLEWKNQTANVAITSQNNKLELDLWKTLYTGYPATKNVIANDVIIDYQFLETTKTSSFDFDKVINFLEKNPEVLDHEFISLANIRLNLSNDDNQVSQTISQLTIKQHNHLKQLLLDSNGELFSNGRLVIESKNLFVNPSYQVTNYLNLTNINLQKLGLLIDNDKLEVFKTANYRHWLTIDDGLLSQGRIEMDNQTADGAAEQLNLVLNLARNSNILSLSSESLLIEAPEQIQADKPKTHLEARIENLAQGDRYDISISNLSLGFISKVVAPFVEPKLYAQMNQFDAAGFVEKAELKLVTENNEIKPIGGELQVRDFVFKGRQEIPSISLDKLLLFGEQGLWHYQVSAQNSSLSWPKLFKEIIPLENLDVAGSFDLTNFKRVDIESLHLKNADVTAILRGKIDFEPLNLSLQAEARDIDIAKLYRYWPRNGSFPKKTLEYLDQALLSGTVDKAKLLFRGDAAGFPYINSDGQFQITAFANDATFKFEQDWPKANGIDAIAIFDNERLEVDALRGNLFGAELQSGRAIIDNLKADDQRLQIEVKGQSGYSSYRQIYETSPMLDLLGRELLEIKYDKTVSLDLDLDILLVDDIKPKVRGQIDFSGNIISGIPYQLEADNVNGQLVFTENGAYTKNVTAEVFQQPFTVDLKIDEFTKADNLLEISARGHVHGQNLLDHFLPKSPELLAGTSSLDLFYVVDKEDEPNESLVVRSDLKGTRIYGPDIISKALAEEKPLLFTLLKSGTNLNLRGVLGDQFKLELDLDEENSEQVNGKVQLGRMATQTVNTPENGVSIAGYFDKIILKEWVLLFKLGPSETGEQAWPPWLNDITLTSPELQVAGQTFTNVRINDIASSGEDLRLNLFSEQARANYRKLSNGQREINFEYLNLQLEPFESLSDQKFEMNLADYDKWRLSCENCSVNGYKFGPLKAKSELVGDDLKITGDAVISNQVSLALNGSMDKQQSNLNINFDIPSPQGLLDYWEMTGDVGDTATKGEAKLMWPGELTDFELAKTNGSLVINAGKGVIRNLSDRKARIFSLFSLQSIPRRLSLDFSDIFSDGFFYNSIKGSFSIENGVMVAQEAKIAGTAADVEISGSVDFNQQTVNQTVTVIPKLGSSLPILAGWAIEPTTGLVMFLVSKIFEPAIDVVASIKYCITGNIEDPKVEEISKESKTIEVSEEELEEQKLKQQRQETPEPQQ